MTISELIKQLQDYQKEYGDIQVVSKVIQSCCPHSDSYNSTSVAVELEYERKPGAIPNYMKFSKDDYITKLNIYGF